MRRMARDIARANEGIVLAHSSDLHVDDPLFPGGYHGLVGLRSVLATASALAADAVLLAGDTFDNARVSVRVLSEARDAIASAGRRVVILPGNHDPLQDASLYRKAGLLDVPNVHVLGGNGSDTLLIEDLDLEIYGLPHVGFTDFKPLSEMRMRATRWQVVMAHGHYVAPGEEAADVHRAWRFDDAALAAAGGDYIALGHWDRPLRVGPESARAYYSGSPDLARTVNTVRLHHHGGVTVTREALIWPSSIDRVEVST